jgi:sialic acid synthase SpsE
MAKRMGCEVIEKHVNLCGYSDTPDAPHSINGEELSLMVRMLKEELPIKDTFRGNPHKRRAKTNGDGTTGFYRPR